MDVDDSWSLLPYLWFAFHWLAMSHSCYNPIIYCYMNARFRVGFITVLHRIPGLRRCICLKRLRGTHNNHINNGESVIGATGLALTGELNFHKNHPKCKQNPNSYTKPTHNISNKVHIEEDEEFDEEDYVNHGTELSKTNLQFRCP